MFGNKRSDVDDVNNIIDGIWYAGTPDFYELIFKRIEDSEDDMNKSMWLATNAHKHK